MSAKLMTKSKKEFESKIAAVRTKTAAATAKTNGKKIKTAKTKGNAKPRRISALDAAAQILKAASKPMGTQELITAMAEKGLWSSPKGKTPHATLSAAMHREVNTKGRDARFAKADRGLFTFNTEARD